MVFGRSSERSRPEPSAGRRRRRRRQGRERGSGAGGKRGPGARAGRRDYSHLPRVEVVWDFAGGGYCCPECGTPFTGLGSDHVTEQLDWLVDRAGGGALPAPVPAGLRLPGPGGGDGARPAEGDRQGPVLQRVPRDGVHRAVRGGAEHELAGDGAGQAGRGGLAGHAGGGLRAGRGAARPAGRGDHGAVAGVVAPARRRDDVAGLRPARGRRPGEMVAVGVPRPGYRLLRDGPQPGRDGPGPPRRHRRGHRPAHRGRRTAGRGGW